MDLVHKSDIEQNKSGTEQVFWMSDETSSRTHKKCSCSSLWGLQSEIFLVYSGQYLGSTWEAKASRSGPIPQPSTTVARIADKVNAGYDRQVSEH